MSQEQSPPSSLRSGVDQDWSAVLSVEAQLNVLQNRWQGKRPPAGTLELQFLEAFEAEEVRLSKDREAAAANASKWVAVDPSREPDWGALREDLLTWKPRARAGLPPTQKQINYCNILVRKLPRNYKSEFRTKVDSCTDRKAMSDLIEEMKALT